MADLGEFWKGQREIKLLDPNITAAKECDELFQNLIDSKAWVYFTQGIDVRMMNEDRALMLNQMKVKAIYFAWDNYEFKTYEKIKAIRPLLKYDRRRLNAYVLTNFNTTHEQDLERIYKLRELEIDPYVMVYDKRNAPKITKQVQRWVNNRPIWRTCAKFEDYAI